MTGVLKRLIKQLVPLPLLRHWNERINRRHNFQQAPADLFGAIYREKKWGGEDRDFYSGTGSHAPKLVEPFITAVRLFLSVFPEPATVVDIGCGDFVVGSRLVDVTRQYIACDVVPELIARNRKLFSGRNLAFKVLDAVADPLPSGEVVIVKQVFQHLRNDQIWAIVSKLSQYPIWIVCEHLPAGMFQPNRDKLADSYSRIHLHSGIVLTDSPFHIKPRVSEVLCEVREYGGVIRTVAYRFYGIMGRS
jgi:hypothetical protein